MKTWLVYVSTQSYTVFKVDAENERDAIEKVLSGDEDVDVYDSDVDVEFDFDFNNMFAEEFEDEQD